MNISIEQQAANQSSILSIASMQQKWQYQLAEVRSQYNSTLEVICWLQNQLDEAETKARQLLAEETRLETLISTHQHKEVKNAQK